MEYRLVNNEYHLYNDGKFILNAGNEVSVSYTYTSDRKSVVYKHGSYDQVKELHDDFINRMLVLNDITGVTCFDTSDCYIISDAFELEELNKMLSICDYIGRIHEKYNIVKVVH